MGKKLQVAKSVVGFTAAIGAGMIVGNVVAATTPLGLKLIPSIFIRVGAIGLGGAAGQAASGYTDSVFDEYQKQRDAITDALVNPEKIFRVDEDDTTKPAEENK